MLVALVCSVLFPFFLFSFFFLLCSRCCRYISSLTVYAFNYTPFFSDTQGPFFWVSTYLHGANTETCLQYPQLATLLGRVRGWGTLATTQVNILVVHFCSNILRAELVFCTRINTHIPSLRFGTEQWQRVLRAVFVVLQPR